MKLSTVIINRVKLNDHIDALYDEIHQSNIQMNISTLHGKVLLATDQIKLYDEIIRSKVMGFTLTSVLLAILVLLTIMPDGRSHLVALYWYCTITLTIGGWIWLNTEAVATVWCMRLLCLAQDLSTIALYSYLVYLAYQP